MNFWGQKDQVTGAVVCIPGLMVFSFFIHYPWPLRLISFAVLLPVTFMISRDLASWADLKKVTGAFRYDRNFLLFMLAGIGYGIFLALFYRWYLETGFFPQTLRWFAVTAALIGSMEELVFRGYVQGQLARRTGLFSVVIGSLSHTGYKCCLFLSPALAPSVDIGFLAICTLLAGVLLGAIRHFSGSVWPAVVAHALFDILVYGENVNPPWWVW